MDPPVDCSTWVDLAEQYKDQVKSNCSSCPTEGIKNCKEQDGEECLECEYEYELSQNKCDFIELTDNCVERHKEDPTLCSACQDEYSLNTNDKCTKTVDGCQTHGADGCTKCTPDNDLVGG